MNFEYPPVAIPSYQRVSTLLHKTLRFLVASNYPQDKITVFVASSGEYVEYRKMLDVTFPKIQAVVGVPGLAAQRAFIAHYYDPGTTLIQLDDDVDGIKFLDPRHDFRGLVRFAINQLDIYNSGLFGILPNDDGRKMEDKVTTHLTHILGSFFICKNSRTLLPAFTEKEDFERSILYFNTYKSVLRWKGAGVKTSYAKTPGGLQQPGRTDRMREGLLLLREKYPKAIQIVEKPKGEDVVLNWRYVPE